MRKSPTYLPSVPSHPVRIGNIPNLICIALIRKHAGTPIWEDCASVACDSEGSKCESPHLSALFCMVPCHPVRIGNI